MRLEYSLRILGIVNDGLVREKILYVFVKFINFKNNWVLVFLLFFIVGFVFFFEGSKVCEIVLYFSGEV